MFIPHLRVIWAEHPQKGLIFGLLTCLITEVHVYKVLPYKKDLMVSSEIWKTSREKMTTSESGKISIPKVLSASWWPSSEI